jgi:hypothetical protein
VNCGQSEFKNENRKTGYKLLQHFRLKWLVTKVIGMDMVKTV